MQNPAYSQHSTQSHHSENQDKAQEQTHFTTSSEELLPGMATPAKDMEGPGPSSRSRDNTQVYMGGKRPNS